MQHNGRIISVGSGAASYTSFPNVADYTSSKAAIAGYTRSWGPDLGPRGITINLAQPGSINTDMNPKNGSYAPLLKSLTAVRRYGQPFEVAAALSFLARPDSSYITGATLYTQLYT